MIGCFCNLEIAFFYDFVICILQKVCIFAFGNAPNRGTLRETFFANQLRYASTVEAAVAGNFIVDGRYTFEVGGAGKTMQQIAGAEDAYIAADDIEYGTSNRIPLWMFGLLY